ncbi:MAG: carbohydrate-binding protein [Microbacteriaceae bacterium]
MFTGKRVSFIRLTGLMVILGLFGFGAVSGWRWLEDSTVDVKDPWFAGYVDITATPTYKFELNTTDTTKHVVLAFVVNSRTQKCQPAWGGVYTPDEASVNLDLDRRIARVYGQQREIILSFGGQLGTELASSCDTVPDLKKAYRTVIDRYQISTIDLDIEGAELANSASSLRRAQAVAELQKEMRAEGKSLAVWLTVPIGPSGMLQDVVNLVQGFLSAGVDLGGVNYMTMNYNSADSGDDLLQTITSSLDFAHQQLGGIYRQAGTYLSDTAIWQKIGVTPMIGQNDVPKEVFSLEQATALNKYIVDKGIRRASLWSLNRDKTCSPNYPNVKIVSDSCSGVNQGDFFYSDMLGADMKGEPNAAAGDVTVPDLTPEDLTDDPKTSPYPLWSADSAYTAGTKVVWKRNVYTAKWWTQGEQPDLPVVDIANQPWTLVGPVLEGETPKPEVTLPKDYYPEWKPDQIYQRSQRVMQDGIAYEAKWWTQSESPDKSLVDPGNASWARISEEEIISLLDPKNS